MAQMPYPEERKRRYSLGVLLTGTLEKKGRFTGSWVSRFYVLTRKALHYYSTQSTTALFGQEKGSFSLLDICDVKAVPWDNRCFQFTVKSHKKTKLFRAEDEEACNSWRTALDEAIVELHKASCPTSFLSSSASSASSLPASAAAASAVSAAGVSTSTGGAEDGAGEGGSGSRIRREVYGTGLSGDYRNKQKYWPRILCVGAGEKGDAVAIVKQDITWGETVRLGSGQYHRSPSAAAVIKLRNDREVILQQRDFQQAVVADYEDRFPVRATHPDASTKRYVMRIRLQSVVKPMPELGVQTFVLPIALIIFASWFLLDFNKFGGRWVVWGLAVLVGSSILYNTYWREVRVWYITPISWERDIRDLHRGIGGGRTRGPGGGSSIIAKCTPLFAFLEWQDEMVIPTDSFLQACEHVAALLETFGMPFRPIQQFLHQCIRRVSEQYKLRPTTSLDLMIQLDVENKAQWKETSASWSILWIKRILEFVVLFLEEFSRTGKPDDSAWTAYKQHIEPYQAFTARTAYSTALLLVPAGRDRFLEQVAKHVPERDREIVVQDDATEFAAALLPLLTSMTDFFVSNGLDAVKAGAGSSRARSGSGADTAGASPIRTHVAAMESPLLLPPPLDDEG